MREVRKFTTQSVLTASPGQLVVMLYDGFARFATQAVVALERGDVANAAEPLSRAQRILTELRASLDSRHGDVASRLDAIYDYVGRRLTDARIQRDPQAVREAIEPMTGLRDAWARIAASQDGANASQELARRPMGVDLVG